MTDTAFGHQVAIAAVLVWVLQMLKRAGWFPWLDANSDTANRIISVIAALVAGAGITFSVMGGIEDGGGVLIKWPALSAMTNGLSHCVVQYVLQEGIYRKMVKA